MNNGLKIGLLREGKTPEDNRVVLTPDQAGESVANYRSLEIVIQPSPSRCYADEEYINAGFALQEDLSDCNILIGVKEVPIDNLLEDKTYFFFSHTIKKQSYNRALLREVIRKNITLIDYECLTDNDGLRVIAFGKWAGIVGAHNGLYTWAQRSTDLELDRARDCKDYVDLLGRYQNIKLPAIKIATTGSGRVARGANELLSKAGVREVSPSEFLEYEFNEAVYASLRCEHLYRRVNDRGFDLSEFFAHPNLYQSIFRPYSLSTDLFINSIYWDPAAPAYFTAGEMAAKDFRIKAIADITCDIAPAASVPSTLRASTIDNPIYGYDPVKQEEVAAHQDDSIDIMAVDNLPNELPRDASHSFGDQFMTYVIPELLKDESDFIARATIAANRDLTKDYEYLRDYVE